MKGQLEGENKEVKHVTQKVSQYNLSNPSLFYIQNKNSYKKHWDVLVEVSNNYTLILLPYHV